MDGPFIFVNLREKNNNIVYLKKMKRKYLIILLRELLYILKNLSLLPPVFSFLFLDELLSLILVIVKYKTQQKNATNIMSSAPSLLHLSFFLCISLGSL